MARITDETKLEAIKKSLIEIIIKDGSANASIAKVAKKANVSGGYLYRHYESKESLIKELYINEFNDLSEILINRCKGTITLKESIFQFYSDMVKKMKSDENSVLFLLKMMTDYSIKITDEMKKQLSEIIELFRNKFGSEIKNIESEHLYMQILGNILMFINVRKRGVLKQSEITKKDIEQLTNMTINALRL